MSCSLRRYMVCYYVATLFVLSLDSNTSGLHVNLLAGWTYVGVLGMGGPQTCLPAACGVAQRGAQHGPSSSTQAQDPREG